MRRLPHLAAALFIVTAVTVTATLADGRRADSATGTAADPARPLAAPTQGTWVTLIAGDRVMSSTLAVDPAQRSSPVAYQQLTRKGDNYVIPADAAELLQAGKLDWQLFNISGLVRQEYDDAHRTELPLLVRYDGEQRAMRSTAALADASVERVLPAVTMASLEAKKSRAARLWNQLRPRQGLSFAGGIGKVWLNAKVKASLDVSVPQIGAPTAWAKGLTGAGVTVAVLDTGIDTDHPDLTGRIGDSQDFSGKGTVEMATVMARRLHSGWNRRSFGRSVPRRRAGRFACYRQGSR
ncbi:S8 family serine peptidase [Kribbella sp. NPDC049227]|uniref:S8 family serine peptidase n=1 Tax=Kribbella sp. NPDC049227 TaxID=3364113 RepID=UPI003713A0C3